MNIIEDYGKKISKARKAKNITQLELASMLYVTDKAISNWETEKNRPDNEIIKKMEKILNIKLIKPNNFNIIKLIINILLLITSIISLIYIINNLNKVQIYTLSLDSNEYYLEDSEIVKINNNIIIKLNDISSKNLPYQKDISARLYYIKDNKETTLKKTNNYNGFYIKDNIKIPKDLYLEIKYTNYNEIEIKENIKINLQKEYSNNKLFYKVEKTDQPDQNIINLLKNNSYQETKPNIFEKEIDSDYYKYDANTNLFYYQGKEDGLEYYAIIEYDSPINLYTNNFNYVILKDNEIIEYQNSKYNMISKSKYKDYINDKIQELNKLKLSE